MAYPQSRAVRRTDAIRRAIVTRRIENGEPISEYPFRSWFGASRTTLEEAYRTLSAENFVKIHPARGPVAWMMPADQAIETFELREALECFAVERFTRDADAVQRATLVRLGEGLAESVLADRVGEMNAWKTRFYECLLDGAGNETLHREVRSIYSSLSHLRARSLALLGRPVESAGEIRAAVKAMELGDTSMAVERWRTHIKHACVAALESS